jgi:tetratricopeptide (TPR) repeat protein
MEYSRRVYLNGRYARAALGALAVWLPVGALAQSTQAEQLVIAGHWKQARALVQMRILEVPNDPLMNYLLSQIRNAFGDHVTPQALAEKAVVLDGSTAKYHRQYAEVLGVMAQHANILQQLRLARRFRKEIDTALMLDPRDTQALRDLIEFYLLAPSVAGGDQRKAWETAGRVAQIDVAEGFLAKARIAEFYKQSPAEEAALRQAAAAQPPSYRALIALARFYLSSEHLNQASAEAIAKQALLLDRGRVDAYSVQAEVCVDRSDWSALDSVLREAGKEVPDDLAPQYHAAERLLAAHHDPARAERYLRIYLGQEAEGNEPGLAVAHWKLGQALHAQGRDHAAIEEWQQSLRLDPESPASRDLKSFSQFPSHGWRQ